VIQQESKSADQQKSSDLQALLDSYGAAAIEPENYSIRRFLSAIVL
jgi:hypothetical protein